MTIEGNGNTMVLENRVTLGDYRDAMPWHRAQDRVTDASDTNAVKLHRRGTCNDSTTPAI